MILNTCTYDHPGALAFYRRHGFAVTHSEAEIVDDPRLVCASSPATPRPTSRWPVPRSMADPIRPGTLVGRGHSLARLDP